MASTSTPTAGFVDAVADLAKDVAREVCGPFSRKATRATVEANTFRLLLDERLATMSPVAAAMVRAEVGRRAQA